MHLTCVTCGKQIDETTMKGFMKHPYCEECFKIVWKDDFQRYERWMMRFHEEPSYMWIGIIIIGVLLASIVALSIWMFNPITFK